jgi:hypothetical protein
MAASESFVPGDRSGLPIPATAEALGESGAGWLTEAFRAQGWLAAGQRVAAITALEAFAGGNSGHKARLKVEYGPGIARPRELFVKFSRDFVDPFRDRRRYELEAEVRLAQLSRHPAFPIPVAAPAFADFHHASGTGLLITERIAFGTGGIAPLRPKNMDHLLPDALDHYRALMRALGRLSGSFRSGALSPEAEALFPFDAAAAAASEQPHGWTAQSFAEAVARHGQFARDCPALVPPVIGADFTATMERDGLAFLAHEAALRRFLHADPAYVALAHWNGHLDNAWFFRGPDGALACGLMDWGMVRQMNLGMSLWGCLSGAEDAMLAAHMDTLLTLFAASFAEAGGPRLDIRRLALHLDIAVMLVAFSMVLDAPRLLIARMPDIDRADGLHDPLLRRDGVVHGFLHVYLNVLARWQRRVFGRSIEAALQAK